MNVERVLRWLSMPHLKDEDEAWLLLPSQESLFLLLMEQKPMLAEVAKVFSFNGTWLAMSEVARGTDESLSYLARMCRSMREQKML